VSERRGQSIQGTKVPKTKKTVERGTKGPLGESREELAKRAMRVLRALRKAYPDAHVPLNYRTPLELMIATILSAQCTDERVNEVTGPLFKRYKTAAAWSRIPVPKLEEMIHSTGFFRNKARSIHEATEDIAKLHRGCVPETIDELLELRGIGRKSANILIAHAFDGQGIVVDTHFSRISRRLGLTTEMDPVKIEFDLMEIVPRKHWTEFALVVNWHGRAACYARKPDCGACAIRKGCPARESRGEITWKVKVPAAKKRSKDEAIWS
jgi:endonuclease-3